MNWREWTGIRNGGGKPTSSSAFGRKSGPASRPVLAAALSFLLALCSFLAVTTLTATPVSAAMAWHQASEIFTGTFPNSSYTFSGNLSINSNLTVAKFLIANGSTLYVDAVNGRVGIGTASPTTKLDVEGSISGTGLLNQTFTNIKKNAGFESGTTDGWTVSASGTYGINSTYSHTGNYSFRIFNSTSYCNNYIYEDFDSKENVSYSVSGWVKRNLENITSGIFISEGVGTGCTQWGRMTSSQLGGTTDWTHEYVENWNSQTCKKIRVGFTLQSCYVSGESFFDDLMVTEGYGPKNYYQRPIVDSYQGDQWIVGGNVGIGTASPGQALTVAGTANITGAAYLGNSKCPSGQVLTTDGTTGLVSCVAASGIGGAVTGNGNAGYIAQWNTTSNINSSAIYQNGSNIGIGTTNPGHKLVVEGTNGVYIRSSNTGADSVGGFSITNDAREWLMRVDGTDSDKFQIRDVGANAQRLIIDSSGNVGINTTNPAEALDVTGNIKLSGYIDNGQKVYTRTYSVNATVNATLLDSSGSPLPLDKSYLIEAYVEGTSTPTGARAIVWNDVGGTRYLTKIYEAGKSSNHVEIFLDNNVPKVRLYSHPGMYTVRVKITETGITVRSSGPFGLGYIYEDGSVGNVGIGTTGPQNKLEVVGTINASAIKVGTTDVCLSTGTNCPTMGGASSAAGWQNTSTLVSLVNTANNVSANTLYVDNSNGRVGIGTTSPGTKLEVAGETKSTSGFYLNKKTLTLTTAPKWLRFAQSTGGGGNNAGIFEIRWSRSGVHGHIIFNAGANFNDVSGFNLNLLGGSSYGSQGITQIRLLRNTTYDTMYLEIYAAYGDATYGMDIEVWQLSGYGWSLLDIVDGSIPAGYTAHTLSTSNAFAVNEDSKTFTVTKAGNVGIGTTSPGAKLDISAGTNTGLNVSQTGGGLYTQTAGGIPRLYVGGGNGFGFNRQNSAEDMFFGEPGDTGTWRVRGAGTISLGVGSSATTTVIQGNGGNVGIGTTNPTSKLHLVETGTSGVYSVNFTNNQGTAAHVLNLYSGGTASGSYAFNVQTGAYNPIFRIYGDSVSAENLAVGTGYSGTVPPSDGAIIQGNVGIGTAVPTSKLHIAGQASHSGPNIYPIADLEDIATGCSGCTLIGQRIVMNDTPGAGSKNVGLWVSATNGVSANYAAIFENGNVGIGTTSPGQKLDVAGNITASLADSRIYYSDRGNMIRQNWGAVFEGGGDATHPNQFRDASLLVGYTAAGGSYGTNNLLVAGNVGIGTTSPGNKLEVVGTINASALKVGTTDVCQSSGTNCPSSLTGANITGSGTSGNITKWTGTSSIGNSVLYESGGKVGIGTTVPSQTLTVAGNINFTGDYLQTNTISKISPIYIRGTGLNNNTNQILKIGSTTVYNTGSRGLTLTILNKPDHSVVSTTAYDTYGNTTQSDNLATALNAMTSWQIGILTSYDAWEAAVTANLDTAFRRLGLYKAYATVNSGSRRTYASIFEAASAGETTDKAVEVSTDNTANQPYAEIRGLLIDGAFVASGSDRNSLTTPQGTALGVLVDPSGYVGIGTASPTHTLTVAGTVNATDFICSGGSCINAADVANDLSCTDIGTSLTSTCVASAADLVCNDCIGDTEITGLTSTSVSSAADLVCNDCISGTEISESGLAHDSLSGAGTVDTESEVEGAVYDNDNTLAGTWTVAASGANDINFDSNTFVVDVDQDRVGIGTASPGAKLQVGTSSYAALTATIAGTPGAPATSGSAQTNGSLRLSTNTSNSQVLDIGIYNASPYGAWLQAVNGGDLSSNSPLILNPNGGNVGIGTASPGSYKLNVNGDAFASTMAVGNVAAGPNYYLQSYPATGADRSVFAAGVSGYSNGFQVMYTNSPQSMKYTFIDGNVGIGTAGPDSTLHVIGGMCAETSDTGCAATSGYVRGNTGLCIGSDCRTGWPTGGGASSAAGWQNTSTLVSLVNTANNVSANTLYVDNSNGRVGIGTTSPGYKLDLSTPASGTVGNAQLFGAGSNLLKGGSFEMWGTSYSNLVVGSCWNGDAQTLTTPTGDAPSGSQILQVAQTHSTGGCNQWSESEYIPVEPNQTYTYSYWAKLVSGSVNNANNMYVREYNSSYVQQTEYGIFGGTLTSSWQRFSYKFTTGANTVFVKLENYNYATGTAQYDGVSLQKGNVATEYAYSPYDIPNKAVGYGDIYVSGNVGINTTNPLATLQVKAATNKEIQIGSTAGTYTSSTYFTDLTALGAVINIARPSDGVFTHSIFGYSAGGSDNLGIVSREDMKFVVGATADRGMIIKSSGNIGIGTTDPSAAKLVVSGNISVSDTIKSGTGNVVIQLG